MRKNACLTDLVIDLKTIAHLCEDRFQFVSMAVKNGFTFREIADWLCVPEYQPMAWYWSKMKKAKND